MNPKKAIEGILTKKSNQKLPLPTLSLLLDLYLQDPLLEMRKMISGQIDRWITPEDIKKQP